LIKLKNVFFIIRITFGLWLTVSSLLAQAQQRPVPRTANPPGSSQPASRPIARPQLPVVRPDTLTLPDSAAVAAAADSATNTVETTVNYTAKDSTILDAAGQIVELYGDAEVTYGTISLKAAYIKLNLSSNEIYARGRYDSTARKEIGLPVFKDGSDQYDSKEIRYNYKTKKGLIQGIVTAQGEGNIRGNKVKKDAEDNLYIRKAIYTTCNLTVPHFHINAPRIKVVHNKQVISGPFNLVVNDIPLPLGLPFGFFPIPKKKEIGTSGLIFPQYGEEPNGRGFFLRDGGYYWAVNENIGMQAKASIYSNGSWGVGLESQYARRYRYGGNFALRFARNRTSSILDIAQQPKNDFSILWSHTPQSRGTRSSFSANVNVSSNSYNQLNAASFQRTIQNVAGSSVQYSRQFGQYVRTGANFRVNQNFGRVNPQTNLRENGQTDISTDFNLGVTQIAPFALKGGTGRWYESFRLGLDFSGQALLNNVRRRIDTTGIGVPIITTQAVRPDSLTARRDSLERIRQGDFSFLTQNLLPFNFQTLPQLVRNMQVGGRYAIPISLPNFKIARYINFTPGISLQGDVYTKQLQYRYDPIFQAVRVDTLSRISSVYTVGMNASLNTRAYGTYFIRGKRLEAIRHTLAPSLSFSFLPDLASSFSQEVQYNERGDTRRLSRYRGLGGSSGYGGNTVGNQAFLSYNLVNQIEMKVRSRSDSAKSEFEKISLFDNISLSGNYNIYAPQFNFSPLTLSANTQILKTINFNFSSTFDPYAYEYQPRRTNVYFVPGQPQIIQRGDFTNDVVLTRVNRLAFQSDQKQNWLHLQNMNFFVSTRFAPKGADKPKQTRQPATPGEEAELRQINTNPDAYVDFNIPWSIDVSYTFALSKFTPIERQLFQQITFNGDLTLTPKWKVSLRSGYDITANAPALTSISVHRDLHCWEMNFSWTPFAGNRFRANFFTFDLRARSSILQDLKLSRRSRGGLNVGTF